MFIFSRIILGILLIKCINIFFGCRFLWMKLFCCKVKKKYVRFCVNKVFIYIIIVLDKVF